MAGGLSFFLKLEDQFSKGMLAGAAAVEKLEKAMGAVNSKTRGGVVKKTGADPEKELAALEKNWDKIAASQAKAQMKADAAAAKQKAKDDAALAKTADKAKIANSVAESHANADILPKLAGLPKLQLAEKELEKLKKQLRDDKLAVTNLSASLRQLEQASHQDIGTMKLLKAELQAKKNSLAEIQTKLVLSGNAAKFGSEGTNRLTTTLRELAEAAGGSGITGLAARLMSPIEAAKGLKGAIGEAGGKLAEVAGISEGAATGIVAVGAAAVGATAAVVALGAGLVGLVVHFAGVALEASEAKNDFMDMMEAMFGSEDAAKGLASSFGQIMNVTSASVGRLRELAVQLSAAEVPANLLSDSIKAIAQAESVLPEAGGKLQKVLEKAGQTGKFQISTKQLVGTGVPLEELFKDIAARTGKGLAEVKARVKAGTIDAAVGIAALNSIISKKFGSVAEKQAHDWSTMTRRFKASIAGLFKDVNTEPFLKAVESVLKLFDQSTVSGKAMHDVLTDVFDGVFNAAAKAIPYVRIGLKGLLNVALNVADGFEPLLIQLGLIGDESSEQSDGLADLTDAFLLVGKEAGKVASAIASLGTKKVALYALAGATALVALPLLAIPALVLAGAAAFVYIAAKIDEFVDALGFIKDQALKAGGDLVSGIVEGIESGAMRLVDAVSKLGKRAIAAFRSIWDMHSPSRVGIALGQNVGGSIGIGVARSGPANDNAMFHALDPEPAKIASPHYSSSGRERGGGTSVSITFAEGAFQLTTTPQGAEELRENMVDIMAEVLEQAMNKAGLAPTGSG